MIPCVILAGGRGTRMEPATSQIPKALVPVAGKPFIDHQLAHLAKTGVTNVLLSIGYRGDQLRDHVKDGKAWGLSVTYVDEGTALRGTGGALRLAYEKGLLEPAFLLTYGDAFLPIDFSEVWRYFQTRSENVLMTVFRNANRWEPSNAVFEADQVTLYQKGIQNASVQYIDYGVLGLRRVWIEKEVPAGVSDLSERLHDASLQGEIAGLEVHQRAYQVGTPEGATDFSNYLQGVH